MDKAFLIQRLQQDYERASTHVRQLESNNDKIIGFGLTIIGIAFAYAIDKDLEAAFFFLPVALIGLFLYAVQQYYFMYWIGGYARAIEDAVNALAGAPLLRWESMIANARTRAAAPDIALVGLYVLILVALSGYCFIHVFQSQPPLIANSFASVVVVLVGLLLGLVRGVGRVFEHAYRASTNELAGISVIGADSSADAA